MPQHHNDTLKQYIHVNKTNKSIYDKNSTKFCYIQTRDGGQPDVVVHVLAESASVSWFVYFPHIATRVNVVAQDPSATRELALYPAFTQILLVHGLRAHHTSNFSPGRPFWSRYGRMSHYDRHRKPSYSIAVYQQPATLKRAVARWRFNRFFEFGRMRRGQCSIFRTNYQHPK